MSDEGLVAHPSRIEERSFEIITAMLGERRFPAFHGSLVKRVIHATADFDYAENLEIGEGAVESAMKAIEGGCNIVTDTKMAAAGINRKSFGAYGGKVVCHIDDEDIVAESRRLGLTRSRLCMDKAAADPRNLVFAIGNAPTALLRLCELIREGRISPALVVGVPVGFVNVLESKAALAEMPGPSIIAQGRKGGSTVAAAIVNAIVYQISRS